MTQARYNTRMPAPSFEQAIYHRQEANKPTLVGRSSGFRPDWEEEAEWLITGFGERPRGVPCPLAVFAQPLGKHHVAVAQVVERDDATTQFRLLVIERRLYERHFGDPFVLADRFPPSWEERGELATLVWPGDPPPPRNVEDIRRVLKRVKASALREGEDPENEEIVRTIDNSESPALLGGAQVLVDGGRVVFRRQKPDAELIRGLWTLLPNSVRARLWPATFAFSNALGFDALVVPRVYGEDFQGYLSEDQAAEYPPGRYEFNLQVAAEEGDQRELDALLGRRSLGDTKRLALLLLIGVTFVAILSQFRFVDETPSTERQQKLATAAGIVAVGDPWTAVQMIHAGNEAWKRE